MGQCKFLRLGLGLCFGLCVGLRLGLCLGLCLGLSLGMCLLLRHASSSGVLFHVCGFVACQCGRPSFSVFHSCARVRLAGWQLWKSRILVRTRKCICCCWCSFLVRGGRCDNAGDHVVGSMHMFPNNRNTHLDQKLPPPKFFRSVLPAAFFCFSNVFGYGAPRRPQARVFVSKSCWRNLAPHEP